MWLLHFSSSAATLTHSSDAVWDSKSPLVEGDSIPPGTLKLKSGVVTLKFGDAVKVTLEGPAEYEVFDSEWTRLQRGTLNAHVLTDGIGFRVETEDANVVDLGTTFCVTVDDKLETDASVFDGKVELSANTNKKRAVINEGRGAYVSQETKRIEQALLVKETASKGWRQLFGISETVGKVRFIDAHSIGNIAALRHDDQITVIPEKMGMMITEPINVTVVEPGFYHHSELKQRIEKLSAEGTGIDSFVIQYNPGQRQVSAAGKNPRFSGTVEFNRSVLGVITRPNPLRATDLIFEKPEFDSDTRVKSRGMESGDRISLSSDRKTLRLSWSVMTKVNSQIDQIRVLVESD